MGKPLSFFCDFRFSIINLNRRERRDSTYIFSLRSSAISAVKVFTFDSELINLDAKASFFFSDFRFSIINLNRRGR